MKLRSDTRNGRQFFAQPSSLESIVTFAPSSSRESLSLSASVETVVTFPPGQHVDFVIHYDNTAFHVHKFVLHHHSAYFRTYFDTLPAPSCSSCKKRKRGNPTSSCQHTHIAHCIRLPSQTTLVARRLVTAADMDLFLRHLYFAAHYCYPPFLPKTDVDIGADPPPAVSLQFPSVQHFSWQTASSPLRLLIVGKAFVWNESLLTLAHYLDCAAMLRQCEAVMLTASSTTDSAWLLTHCWRNLEYASRYKLDKLKACHIDIIAADKRMLDREEYKRGKLWWDKALGMEIMEAALKRRA